MRSFIIVIPAYNEEENIGNVLQQLISRNLDADILVVNDGSIDRTEAISRRYPVKLLSHPTNLGYGAALQTGFKYAALKGYEYILQFDSDGQHNPDDLTVIMKELQRGEADVVIGSRFLGDPHFNPGAMKRIAIGLFRFLIRCFTANSVTDPTSGLRGLNRNVFRYYSVRDRFPSDFPDADIIIQMLLNKFRIQEVPIHSQSRLAGVSMHSGLKPVIYIFKILLSILNVVLTHGLVKWRKQHG
jgi:glycosyltransferase involved in cell wall biosynthesis